MTKPIYEVVTNYAGDTMLKRTDPDGKIWSIPMVADNADYQRYLRLLENPNAEESGTL